MNTRLDLDPHDFEGLLHTAQQRERAKWQDEGEDCYPCSDGFDAATLAIVLSLVVALIFGVRYFWG